MAQTKSRFTKEEIAQIGDAIYEAKVRPRLKKRDQDRIVAIDIASGEWEFGDSVLEACDRLEARVVNPETYCVRVGSRFVYRFGQSTYSSRDR